ncbi:hypothetical protein [Phytomonospora endophytica]|uniref:Uncharacterized protein n=1 Tax=Phytomonospora endophytica TaxID=714109 RepID=A0A841FP42_9ACTN|nr:hypothetical protein [Phytomonospora endophytica]MBB6037866.1 hypothetical protein [Phytomonospora endophytica]GIG68765.1 hypothetical protein Pen01_50600 [Phytomonospora endophytica]
MDLRAKRVVIAVVVVAGIAAALLITRKIVPAYVPAADPSPTPTYSTELTAEVFADSVDVRDPADFSRFITLSLDERGALTGCPLVEEFERCVGAVEAAYSSPGGEFRLTATVLAFDEVIGAREIDDDLDATDVLAEVVEPPAGVPPQGRYWWAFGDLSRFVVVTTAGLASGEEPNRAQDDQAAGLSVRFYHQICLLLRLGYR